MIMGRRNDPNPTLNLAPNLLPNLNPHLILSLVVDSSNERETAEREKDYE